MSVMTMVVMTVTMMPDDHSKKARLGPLEGRPLGGVGGRSSLMAAIQVSFMGCGVGGSSSASSLLSLALMAAEELGGRGWISLGTMTKSRPSTRMAPAQSTNTPQILALPQASCIDLVYSMHLHSQGKHLS